MEQDPTPSQTPKAEAQAAPKQSNFLITLLSILLLIACLIAGFFAYQTQKLVKELRVTSDEPKSTPVATQSPDPTADWKTYSNKEYGYEIRYPNNLTLQEQLPTTYFFLLNPEDPQSGVFWIDERQIELPTSEDKNSKVFVVEKNKIRINCIKQYCESALYSEIISTFKFIEPEASTSPLPVACTMDAKICPDGSAVGRSGPKCEFEACPTPKN